MEAAPLCWDAGSTAATASTLELAEEDLLAPLPEFSQRNAWRRPARLVAVLGSLALGTALVLGGLHLTQRRWHSTTVGSHGRSRGDLDSTLLTKVSNGPAACLLPMSFIETLPVILYYQKGNGLVEAFGSQKFPDGSTGLDRLPRHDILEELEQRGVFKKGKPKTCAVVSSSGRIALHKLGSEIDAHDVVLRFNFAVTDGFEESAGSKTTIRMINQEVLNMTVPKGKPIAPELDKVGPDGLRPIVAIRDFQDRTDLKEWLIESRYHVMDNLMSWSWEHPETPTFLLAGPFHKYAFDAMKEARKVCKKEDPTGFHNMTTSTGMEGVLLSLQLCDVVDVYEIAPSDTTSYRKYYWSAPQTEPDHYCPHNCPVEREILEWSNSGAPEDLKTKGKIHLDKASLFRRFPWLAYRRYAPNCPPPGYTLGKQ